jgi:hypothetical protein
MMEIKCIQDIIGTLLYYAQAVDLALLAALSAITARQSNGTRAVANHVTNSSTTLLHIPIQAFNTRCATCLCWYTWMHHTCLYQVVKVEQLDISTYPIAMTKTSTMAPFSPCLQSSNMSCCQHPKQNLPHSTTAASLPPHFEPHKELGHFQPTPTPITTDNITAQGLTMGTMTPKASKLMDQCFYWLKCQHAQCQFQCLWRKGILNCPDYSSKHHISKHRQNVCPFFVFDNTTFSEQ